MVCNKGCVKKKEMVGVGVKEEETEEEVPVRCPTLTLTMRLRAAMQINQLWSNLSAIFNSKWSLLFVCVCVCGGFALGLQSFASALVHRALSAWPSPAHVSRLYVFFFFPASPCMCVCCLWCYVKWSSDLICDSVALLSSGCVSLWYHTCDDRGFELKPFLTRCEVVRKEEDNHTPVFQLQSSSDCSFWCTSKHFVKRAQTWPYCLVFISALLMQSRAYTHKTTRINRSFFSFHTASFLFSGC